jgi:hypothetical protein
MKDLHRDIPELLHNEDVSAELPVASPFDGIYLPAHRLQVNMIALSHPSLHRISSDHFASMSDQALAMDIRMIHLWEDVYERYPALAGARILSMIGTRNRIHARQCTVVRLDKERADNFLDRHHMQQSASAYYKYGLEHRGELVAVATFSKSRVMNDGIVPYRSYELVRFASLAGTTVTGGMGKLLGYFIQTHHPAHLMTYADRDWSAGAGYEKLGFTLAGPTPPQQFYVHPQQMIRYPANRLPQGVSEEMLVVQGYIRISNAGNLKYVMDLRK